ncbi:MAG: P-loop NTPase [Sulfitobacter sp.]
MSFAQNDIQAGAAQIIPEPETTPAREKPKVLVVSRTPSIGHAMAGEMAQDSSVAGFVAHGTLGHIVAQGDQDWTAIKFVVFEISDDVQTDLQALASLQEQPQSDLQFVAMTGLPLAPEQSALFEAAGVREILTIDTAQNAAAETATAVGAPVPAPNLQPDSGGKITVILRARGGAGASTLAVNLAVANAGTSGAGKTALVDLDIQNSAISLMMDLPESTAASEMLRGTRSPDAGFLETAMVRHDSGVDVLTAPDVFAPLTALSISAVETLLGALKAQYDTVIIDMPQGIVDWINPVLAHAARVLMVSDTSLPSVKRTRRLLDLIKEEHMTLPVEVVINQHKRPMVMSATLKEVEKLIGRPLNHWIPMDAKAVRRAIDMGQPLQSSAKWSSATRAINALSHTLFAKRQRG